MKAEKHLPKELERFKWKKGVSGNPAGRPVGKSLKEFAREYLLSLPDEEKLAYLATLPTEITWKMAEGNPASDDNLNIKGKLTVVEIAAEVIEKNEINTRTESDS